MISLGSVITTKCLYLEVVLPVQVQKNKKNSWKLIPIINIFIYYIFMQWIIQVIKIPVVFLCGYVNMQN